jgi:hypothetical protein
MALNNSSNQQFSNNADGFALGGGTTLRTVTLSGGNLSIALATLATGHILQYNGTNFVNVPANTFGTGSVTSVAVSGANGIGVTGSPITNAGTIALTLGNITPTTVTATGTIGALNFSGTSSGNNTGDQTITLSGDASGTGTGAIAVTLANSGVTAGTYGSQTNPAIVVVDGKGRVTSASTGTITLGTGSVVSVVAGTGLTGGTITNAGTIALGTSGVTAGTYNQVVVDVYGRVTSGAGYDPSYVNVTGTSQAAAPNVGYIANNAALNYIKNLTTFYNFKL